LFLVAGNTRVIGNIATLNGGAGFELSRVVSINFRPHFPATA